MLGTTCTDLLKGRVKKYKFVIFYNSYSMVQKKRIQQWMARYKSVFMYFVNA